MKRAVGWVVAFGVVAALGSLRVFEPKLEPPPGREVVLLSAAWCGICAEARRFLRGGGVAFEEYDIERTERGRALYEALGGGGVPILLVDGAPLRGLDRAGWADALNAARPAEPATACEEGARC